MAGGSFVTTGRSRLAWSLFATTVALLIAMVVLSVGRGEAFDTILYGLLWLALGGVGALIASRRPDNRIGWIFLGQGLFGALAEAAEGWGQFAAEFDLPVGALGEWIILWSWIVDLSAWTLVFLLFPRRPSSQPPLAVLAVGIGRTRRVDFEDHDVVAGGIRRASSSSKNLTSEEAGGRPSSAVHPTG